MKTVTTKRKILGGALLLALVCTFPLPAMAEVHVGIGIGIGLPPPIVFGGPPELVVLPGSNVYVAPDVEADIFFYNGWWWRPWEGRWYRSRSYDSGWGYYRHVPYFYRHFPRDWDWRRDYREHRWHGREWNYERMHYDHVQRNWRGWERSRHWERQQPSRRPHDSFRRPDARHSSPAVQRQNTGFRHQSPAVQRQNTGFQHQSPAVQQHNSHRGAQPGGQEPHKRWNQ